MTNLIVAISAMAVYIAYILSSTRRNMHMLQLNSYRNERYIRWYLVHLSARITNALPIFSIVVLYITKNQIYFIILWAATYIILICMRERSAEKKRFVVTSRIKRLLTAICIILLLVSICGVRICVYGNSLETALFFLLIAFSGEIKITYVLLANTINHPIENAVQRWYFNDAKKILAKSSGIKILGITGSYGKTSAKHIVTELLSVKYNVLMTPESYNTTMGVVRTIRERLKPVHTMFVVEMGAKQPGDIREICDLVRPSYGLLTSIGPMHLETFKTIERITETKFELVDSLPSNGIAFLNYDCELISNKDVCANKITYGIDNPSLSYWAEDIVYMPTGMSFSLCTQSGIKKELKTRLLGRNNVLNILSACAIAAEMGISIDDIAVAVKRVQAIPHRLELNNKNPGMTIIDDSFNSNPQGAKEALNVLAGFQSSYKVLVTPGMVELGDKEYEYNRILGEQAAEVCDYVILVGVNRAVPIAEGLKRAGYPDDNCCVAKDLQEAIAIMRAIDRSDVVVLLENDLPDNF